MPKHIKDAIAVGIARERDDEIFEGKQKNADGVEARSVTGMNEIPESSRRTTTSKSGGSADTIRLRSHRSPSTTRDGVRDSDDNDGEEERDELSESDESEKVAGQSSVKRRDKSLHPMSKRRRLSVNRAVSCCHRYILVKLNLRPAIV